MYTENKNDLPEFQINHGINISRNNLLNVLKTRFSKEQFRELCFKLGYDLDNLKGENLDSQKITLIQECERKNKLNQLKKAIQELDPEITFEE